MTLVGGFLEECSLRPLKVLQPQWNDLDTLTLSGMADSGNFMGMPPDVFSQISSLTHVRILENNACDIFIYAVDHNPHFPRVLEVLEIKSTSGYDLSWQKSPRIPICRWFLGGLDNHLASYIPSSIEKLKLHFTRSLPFLHDFDNWIKQASDRSWLPISAESRSKELSQRSRRPIG